MFPELIRKTLVMGLFARDALIERYGVFVVFVRGDLKDNT